MFGGFTFLTNFFIYAKDFLRIFLRLIIIRTLHICINYLNIFHIYLHGCSPRYKQNEHKCLFVYNGCCCFFFFF